VYPQPSFRPRNLSALIIPNAREEDSDGDKKRADGKSQLKRTPCVGRPFVYLSRFRFIELSFRLSAVAVDGN
jgi:hypothetical protein